GVMFLLLIFVGWQAKKAQGEAAARREEQKFAAVKTKAQELNQQGKNLVREGKWIEAKARFEEVLQVMPDYGNGTVQQYIQKTEVEIPSQQHLDAADFALNGSPTKLGTAHKELDLVDANTQQYERRDKLKVLLEQKMES